MKEEPNHTTARKPDPLLIIQFSLVYGVGRARLRRLFQKRFGDYFKLLFPWNGGNKMLKTIK